MVLKKIYNQLHTIKQELHAIHEDMEPHLWIEIDARAVSEASRDSIQAALTSCQNSSRRQTQ